MDEEDILKRRMLSNYCYWFLKEDLKEHIYLLRVQKAKKKGYKMEKFPKSLHDHILNCLRNREISPSTIKNGTQIVSFKSDGENYDMYLTHPYPVFLKSIRTRDKKEMTELDYSE